MDDLFAIPRDKYLDFISFAVYKELELHNGFKMSFGHVKENFNENILVKNYNIKNFILTKQGIAFLFQLFYHRWHRICTFFEISYD